MEYKKLKETLYYISLHYATFGIIVNEINIIKKTAPIGKWMLSKHISEIEIWVNKKKGIIEKVNDKKTDNIESNRLENSNDSE